MIASFGHAFICIVLSAACVPLIIDRSLSYAYMLIGNYVLVTSVETGCQCCLKIDVRYNEAVSVNERQQHRHAVCLCPAVRRTVAGRRKTAHYKEV